MKVFVADDSYQIRSSLKDMIDDIAGIELIGQASDVVNLPDTIKSLKPHILILDVKMPGGSGIGVLKKIKDEHPSTTVIMFTDYSYNIYREKCMELGADYFFEKSREFEKIENILKNLKHDFIVSQLEN